MDTSLSNVTRVYNGKPGCMCGCNGKYTTPEESTRSVKIIYNKVMNHDRVVIDEMGGFAYVPTTRDSTRNQVVYFNK